MQLRFSNIYVVVVSMLFVWFKCAKVLEEFPAHGERCNSKIKILANYFTVAFATLLSLKLCFI